MMHQKGWLEVIKWLNGNHVLEEAITITDRCQQHETFGAPYNTIRMNHVASSLPEEPYAESYFN